MVKFQKMNGAGNDFVMFDNRDGALQLSGGQIARICDRHRGVGADGILLVEPAQNGANFRMRYYNSDGGEAEMCGNGARCFARFAHQISGSAPMLTFETLAGVIEARISDEQVTLTMSSPHDLRLDRSLPVEDETAQIHFINTGVPHAVEFVDHLERVDVVKRGGALRYHPAFQPRGTNANFVKKLSDHVIAIRTYERGVEGETLACGTGVVASALLHALVHGIGSPISVEVRGGDTLEVGFVRTGEHFENVTLTGPADFVFEGEIEIGG
ncbi:MAG: diaminopimelate epimerase [Chthoniobacterales bacterium]